jgi:hypothetical protein
MEETDTAPRPEAAVETDSTITPITPAAAETEKAVYEYDPDKGSIFDSGSNAVDYDMGVDLASGGAVPTVYAARGASVINPTGETGGALSMNDVTNRGAFYTGDNEYGAVQGPPEEGEDFGSPTMYKPEGPAIEDGEAAGRTANLNLSRDPEELAMEAVPAIAAGVERIQAELKPSGAISAEDPAYQEKLQKFARGEGRMSEEEIKQLDSVVDPDGKLAPAARSAARLAAIYKFYQDKGEPDTARDVAARVILYDKFASQTRGAMALQALKDGDIESGVKLLEDGYNYNMPDAKTLRAARDNTGKVEFNDDGTINFNLGWDKLTGFKTIEGGRASKQDLIQLADATKAGTVHMDRLIRSVEAGRSGKSGGTAAANRAQAAATGEAFLKEVNSVEAAARNVAVARASGDQDAIRAAEENYRAIDARARNMAGIRSTAEINSRTIAVDKARDRGLSGGVSGERTPAKNLSKEEREAAAAEAELKRLYGERVAIETGLASSRGVQAGGTQARTPGMSEATAAEIARRSYGAKTPDLYAVDAGVGTTAERARMANIGAVGALGYKGAEDAPVDSGAEKGSINALAAPYLKALEGEEAENGKRVGGILSRAKKDARGNVDTTTASPPLTDTERQMFTDIFGRLAKKNTTLSRETMAQTVYDIARPRAQEIMTGERPEIDWKNKTINYKGRAIYVDEASMRDLAAMRGQTVQEFFRNEREAASTKQGKLVKGIENDLNFTDKKIAELEQASKMSASGARRTLRSDARDAAETRRQEELRKLEARRSQLLGQADIYGIKR